jgi:glycosidase
MVQADGREVEFRFRPAGSAKTVALAGTFNGWNRDANAMKLSSDGKTWTLRLRVGYGRHQYKFVVDGNTWLVDPHNARTEDDGSGNLNSILLVEPRDYDRPASSRDGQIATSALLHGQFVPDRNYDRGALSLRLRVRPNDLANIEAVSSTGAKAKLTRSGGNEMFANYRGQLPWDGKSELRYRFRLTDGAKSVWFGPNGIGDTGWFEVDAKSFPPFQVPQWVERSVFYQVFPDRFLNADKANDPKDVVAWDTAPKWFNRFGGDIAGVRKRIPYLRSLGVGAVYFNPIFESPSNHRYDASDFKRIAPDFGTNEEYRALSKELNAAGMKTIMDFVFNHTAVTFPPFYDIRKNGESSKFRDWYFIHSYPVRVQDPPNYAAWYNFPSMPKVNLSNPEARKYMLEVFDYWYKNSQLDGLRLDVANEVQMDFWQELRTRVKAKNSDLWIVGEVWGDGSPWLKGDQWDSVMNYQFRDAAVRFIAQGNMTAAQFADRLMQVHESYAPQVSRNMMNLLSSHDTPRFLTLAGNDRELAKLGALLQFTWIGAPSIYYGEEIGMEGGPDPDNRRGMRWDLANDRNSMLSHYRKLATIRNGLRALQSGDPAVVHVDNVKQSVAFTRTFGKEWNLVVLNRSNETQTLNVRIPSTITVSTPELVDIFTGKRLRVTGNDLVLSLQKQTGMILAPVTAETIRLAAKAEESARRGLGNPVNN